MFAELVSPSDFDEVDECNDAADGEPCNDAVEFCDEPNFRPAVVGLCFVPDGLVRLLILALALILPLLPGLVVAWAPVFGRTIADGCPNRLGRRVGFSSAYNCECDGVPACDA